MKTIDWNLLKIQYEVFGVSFDDLAHQYGTSIAALEYAAEERGWKRLPVAAGMNQWQEQPENITDEILDGVRHRLKLLDTIKQSTFSPQYVALEAAILGKLESLVSALDTSLPTASTQLKGVAEVMGMLRERSSAQLVGEDGKEGKGVTVKILTQVGDGRGPTSAIQIES